MVSTSIVTAHSCYYPLQQPDSGSFSPPTVQHHQALKYQPASIQQQQQHQHLQQQQQQQHYSTAVNDDLESIDDVFHPEEDHDFVELQPFYGQDALTEPPTGLKNTESYSRCIKPVVSPTSNDLSRAATLGVNYRPNYSTEVFPTQPLLVSRARGSYTTQPPITPSLNLLSHMSPRVHYTNVISNPTSYLGYRFPTKISLLSSESTIGGTSVISLSSPDAIRTTTTARQPVFQMTTSLDWDKFASTTPPSNALAFSYPRSSHPLANRSVTCEPQFDTYSTEAVSPAYLCDPTLTSQERDVPSLDALTRSPAPSGGITGALFTNITQPMASTELQVAPVVTSEVSSPSASITTFVSSRNSIAHDVELEKLISRKTSQVVPSVATRQHQDPATSAAHHEDPRVRPYSRKHPAVKGTREYVEKRIRNNEAVRKSRRKAKIMQAEVGSKMSELELENRKLREALAAAGLKSVAIKAGPV